MKVHEFPQASSDSHALYRPALTVRGVKDRTYQILTDRKAWTMSALTELRGLSLITTKICSSFSKPIKFPNHDFLASLVDRKYCKTKCTEPQKGRNI